MRIYKDIFNGNRFLSMCCVLFCCLHLFFLLFMWILSEGRKLAWTISFFWRVAAPMIAMFSIWADLFLCYILFVCHRWRDVLWQLPDEADWGCHVRSDWQGEDELTSCQMLNVVKILSFFLFVVCFQEGWWSHSGGGQPICWGSRWGSWRRCRVWLRYCTRPQARWELRLPVQEGLPRLPQGVHEQVSGFPIGLSADFLMWCFVFRVVAKLNETNPGEVSTFKTKMNEVMKGVLTRYKDLQFFTGKFSGCAGVVVFI